MITVIPTYSRTGALRKTVSTSSDPSQPKVVTTFKYDEHTRIVLVTKKFKYPRACKRRKA